MDKKYINHEGYESGSNWATESKQGSSSWLSWLNNAWNHLNCMLKTNNEPKIWREYDRMGQSWWRVYDPITQKSAWLSTEAEVRIWLEKLTYHSSSYLYK